MEGLKGRTAALARFLNRYFLWALLGSYTLAAVWPAAGLWLKDVSPGEVAFFGAKMRVTLPMALLALLLVNAGLGVRPARLGEVPRRALVLFVGLAANLAIPIAFAFGLTHLLRFWHNPDEVQNLLVGLALVASMPVAGSSTAWSQNANGDMAVSLGLVLLSTLLSPLTTPAALHAVGLMASGDSSAQLHRLAAQGTGGFLAVCVVLPSLMGLLGRAAIGGDRAEAARPGLKLVNSVTLLVLNYSNGAVSLPHAVADPDWDFLAVTLGAALGLCVAAFAAGWGLGRLLGAGAGQRVALMFGLGMNNNGAGLVLASVALGGYPRVMLPLIFYNLVQHLGAGAVAALLGRAPAGRGPTGARYSNVCMLIYGSR
jgi:BASS family bile acid:Na+ symporter